MFLTKWLRTRTSRKPQPRRSALAVEALESRLVPYSLSGNAWVHPELITLSFVPDGTVLAVGPGGNITSNLFNKFNTKFGSAATWQNQILKAAQHWAAQTNINFAVVGDSGANAGSGSYQQGDSQFGDVRIGGYNFGNNSLASAYYPMPANNYSIAGDFNFNTNQTFNIGSTYDLFSVALHEIGHVLGLGHSSSSTAVMYGTYNGTKVKLATDDVNGIRAIYSSGAARAHDAYDATASNDSFATASNITAAINTGTLTALVTDLDLSRTTDQSYYTTNDVDYYTFTVPEGTTGTMKVIVQSSGLSLLAPKVEVYDAGQVLKGSATALGDRDGATLTVTVNNVSAGETYYVKVSGPETSSGWRVFNTGKYALVLNFGNGADPSVPLPNTQTANGDPLQGGGGIPQAPGNGDYEDDHHDGAADPYFAADSHHDEAAHPVLPGANKAAGQVTDLSANQSMTPLTTVSSSDSPLLAAGTVGVREAVVGRLLTPANPLTVVPVPPAPVAARATHTEGAMPRPAVTPAVVVDGNQLTDGREDVTAGEVGVLQAAPQAPEAQDAAEELPAPAIESAEVSTDACFANEEMVAMLVTPKAELAVDDGTWNPAAALAASAILFGALGAQRKDERSRRLQIR